MPRPIYLDHNATTPLDARVLDAMLPYLKERFGNAASAHFYGWEAKAAVESARERLTHGIGAKDAARLVFTSGTTEANNLALKGIALASAKPLRIVTQATEHGCVIESARELARLGHEVVFCDVDKEGFVTPESLRAKLTPDTDLVSVMAANNEIGTIQDIAALVRVTRASGRALFHCDAAQAVGKVAVDAAAWDVDLLSFSAHKIYGPKGVGALYVAPRLPRIQLHPLLHGGGHENGLRSGTLDVAGIVGFAAALELCLAEREPEAARQMRLRDLFVDTLLARLDLCRLNGPVQNRLPNNANLFIGGVAADDLIAGLRGACVSSGAACSSGGTEPSHVLRAIGLTNDEARSSLRAAVGRSTTEGDILAAADEIAAVAERLRANSPAYELLKREIGDA